MLCLTCQSLAFKCLDDWHDKRREIQNPANKSFRSFHPKSSGDGRIFAFHHNSHESLIASADQGCHLCTLIVHSLRPEKPFEAPESQISSSDGAAPSPVIISLFARTLDCWFDAPQGEWFNVHCGSLHCELTIMGPEGSSIEPFASEMVNLASERKKIGLSSTWSDFNVRLARYWYQRCTEEHPNCQNKTRLLPTRVIDLAQDQPSLVEPPQGSDERYAILSHCWGDTKPLELRKDLTVSGLWQLPKFEDWPLTFRQAVQVTRDFEIRYLWIDSCCIFQGPENRADWETESKYMAQYFGNATFTIAAKFAASGRDGLFSQRNLLLSFPLRVELLQLGSKRPRKTIYLRTEQLNLPFSDFSRKDSPLHSRAWVLQEETLSPRVLGFGRNRVFWDCLGATWTERVPGGGKQSCDPDLALMHMKIPSRLDESDLCEGRNRSYDVLYKLVDELNHRNIRYHNDISIAISCLALSIQPALEPNEQYVAGLWKNDLSVGLLWYVGAFHSGRLSIPQNTQNFVLQDAPGPSWSWISQAHRRVLIGLHPVIMYPGGILNTGPCATKLISIKPKLQNELLPYGIMTQCALRFWAQCVWVRILVDQPVELSLDNQKLESPRCPKESYLFPKQMVVLTPHDFDSSYAFRDPKSQILGDALLDDVELYEKRHGLGSVYHSPLRRRSNSIKAVFLPFLHHASDACFSGFSTEPERTIGLLLRTSKSNCNKISAPSPIGLERSSSTDVPANQVPEMVHETQNPNKKLFRRIGRGSLNLSIEEWQRSRLHFEEINLV